MKISELLIVLVIGLGVSLGMITFMSDLSQSYDITLPSSLKNESERVLYGMNETTGEIIETLSGSNQSNWVQTAYNIFFRSPVTMISTISTTTSLGTSFVSEMAGTEIGVEGGIPDWVIVMIFALIAILVAFGLLMFIGVRA